MLEAKGRIRLKPSCEEWVKESSRYTGLALRTDHARDCAGEQSDCPDHSTADPVDRIIGGDGEKGWGPS